MNNQQKETKPLRKVRRVKGTNIAKQDNFKFTKEELQPLAEYLDTPQAAHLHTLYFMSDGNWATNSFPYEGKFYARLIWESVQINGKWVRKQVGKPQFEIVKTMDAEEILDLVFDDTVQPVVKESKKK